MRSALLLLLPLAALATPTGSAAQVRRCVDAQGNTVYTDRACAAMDATPKEAPVSHAGAYSSGFAARGCARSPGQLLDGVRGALEARDVNRLANYYHWTGTGSGTARSLMDSLEAIAARPLVNAQLVYPAMLPELDETGFPVYAEASTTSGPEGTAGYGPAASDDRYAGRPQARAGLNANLGASNAAADPDSTQATTDTGPGPYTTDPGARTPDTTITAAAGPPPESLLVQQMSGAQDAGSAQVRFQLRRNAGCWWIQL
ncbi:DUF4124 domain-containing protein [Arenimonas sp. MALMAid1274]|uniref:DUF4124 domain-containing protein n=1 Tax=Arenimonas sp. MALMAid1274 TaxID=3411630 RepID=UPI003B9FBEF9